MLFGRSVSRTPMTSTFIHFQSPADWQWDDTYIATWSLQRTWIRFGKYFSLDPEIGFGQRLGDDRLGRNRRFVLRLRDGCLSGYR